MGMRFPLPEINWLSSHKNRNRLIYNQGHTHIKKFDFPPDVQMYCCGETYLLPPACCSRLLVLPNVVLFVMRTTPPERRLLCRVELSCTVKTVKECKWLSRDYSFIFFVFYLSSSSLYHLPRWEYSRAIQFFVCLCIFVRDTEAFFSVNTVHDVQSWQRSLISKMVIKNRPRLTSDWSNHVF